MSSFFVRARDFFRSLLPQRSPRKYSSLSPKFDLKELEDRLLYHIRNKDIFIQALVHRSYIPFIDRLPRESNERLEFLGDAVLNLVVAEYLYTVYPQSEEGELTVLRSRLVNRKALVYYSNSIQLRSFLLVGSNNPKAQKGSDTIVADAFEAMIAALYLDGGLSTARDFILRQLAAALNDGFLEATDKNYKSELLEFSQSQGKGVPRYSIIKEEGPDHDRTFTVEVVIEQTPLGVGVGKNKKEAEQAAAEQALHNLHSTK